MGEANVTNIDLQLTMNVSNLNGCFKISYLIFCENTKEVPKEKNI